MRQKRVVYFRLPFAGRVQVLASLSRYTQWVAIGNGRLLLSRHALHSAVLRVEETGEEWFAPLAPDLSDFLREGSPSYVFPADLSPDKESSPG